MARKPTDYVQFKLRIRQSLLKQLQREAAKKKHSANNEAVERLEKSFADDEKEMRDSTILDKWINGDLRGSIARTMALKLARDPNWNGVKLAEEMLEMLDEDEKEKAEEEKAQKEGYK